MTILIASPEMTIIIASPEMIRMASTEKSIFYEARLDIPK